MGLLKAWKEARDARSVVIDADGVRVSGYSPQAAARLAMAGLALIDFEMVEPGDGECCASCGSSSVHWRPQHRASR
jgi:hypothetical protein